MPKKWIEDATTELYLAGSSREIPADSKGFFSASRVIGPQGTYSCPFSGLDLLEEMLQVSNGRESKTNFHRSRFSYERSFGVSHPRITGRITS